MTDIPTMSAEAMHQQLRALREGADDNWIIRLHRAISGLEQAEAIAPATAGPATSTPEPRSPTRGG